jgi:hypothetical protein
MSFVHIAIPWSMVNRTVCVSYCGVQWQHLLLVRVAAYCLTAVATCSDETTKCLHDNGQCQLVNCSATCAMETTASCDVVRLTATAVQVQYISKLTWLTSPVVLAHYRIVLVNVNGNQINNRNTFLEIHFWKLTHMSDFF